MLKKFCNESERNVMELYTTSKPDMQEAFPKKKVWYRKWSRFQRGIQCNFCYKNKKDDKVAVMHRDPISRPDLQKLYTSFNLEEVEDYKTKCLLTICGISVTGVGKSLENWKLAFFHWWGCWWQTKCVYGKGSCDQKP